MNRFILEISAFLPRCAPVSRLEEAARQVVSVRTDVQHLGITRINDDLIDEEPRLAEVIKEPPLLAAIIRRVNLAVERPEIETVGILRIDHEGANVAALRPGGAPVV